MVENKKSRERKKILSGGNIPGAILITIYSYMTVDELLYKISKLSNKDRKMLLNN